MDGLTYTALVLVCPIALALAAVTCETATRHAKANACPNCGARGLHVIEFNHGRDPQTGYEDEGEALCCPACRWHRTL